MILVVFAVCAGAFVLAGASDKKGTEGRTYKIMFDNAFGLTKGGDFRVGGVNAGQTTSFDVEKKEGAKEISFARPYTTDFLGWFDDFSTTGGGFDALGATARGFLTMSEFLHPDSLATGQYRRCPGAAEAPAKDGSNVLSEAERERLGCDESHRGTPK